MKVFDRTSLEQYLGKLAAELDTKTTIYIIGGASAILAYDTKTATLDIDLWETSKALQAAHSMVIKKFPHLRIHLGPAHVHIQSNEMLKRFSPLTTLNFPKLKIMVPTPEDLFLLKAQRADEKDLNDLINLHRKQQLNEKLLIERFLGDVLPLNYSNDEFLVTNYLLCIERVFDSETGEAHQAKIGSDTSM